MSSASYVRDLFERASQGADLAVIEGVMGLFDGADAAGLAGSTAEIAQWLDAPVILVVDAHGVSRSLAALVHGFVTFDKRVRVVGIIANHVGSKLHGRKLADSLEASGLPPLIGAVPRGGLPTLPHRHLGLVRADERSLPDGILSLFADAFDSYVDVSKLLTLAHDNVPARAQPLATPRASSVKRIRVGLAWDEAFHFYYPDNLEALESAGCELVRFSPLHDTMLPSSLSGLYLGGGYPESHAAQLSNNQSMLDSIRTFAGINRPIYAECGGLMYLSQGIVDREGHRHPMLGILPCWTRMLERLKRLGYVEVTLREDSLLGTKGDCVRGHEYHYSELLTDPTDATAWRRVYEVRRSRGEDSHPEGFQRDQILASYVHSHFASRPKAAKRFADVCGAFAEEHHACPSPHPHPPR
jgi:cobyrinic acid a,c-diamide synthase